MILSEGTDQLFVHLTPEELAEKSLLLSTRIGQLEVFNSEEKDFRAEMKAKREPLQVEISELARTIRYRQELRTVPVRVEANFERNVASVVRTDTGEVVRERSLTMDERQGRMFSLPAAVGDESPAPKRRKN